MNRFLIVLVLFLGFSNGLYAQRMAYVDTQYILDNVPEYQVAQNQLNEMSEQWQKEIEGKFTMVGKKRREYEAEKILLPAEMKKQRENEITALESSAKELQKRRFGVGGDLFLKREELIKPIQDRIFNAIQQVASERNYSFVFDKANQSNLLFADPKFDISKQVLRKMGITIDRN